MKGLLLVVFVNFVGVGALIPVLPYAVIDEAGGSEFSMAMLMASFALAMFVGSPILGSLSDRIGRKKVLITSILITTIGYMIFALTTNLALMFVARIISGLASGNISVVHAIITDNTEADQRARWMGLMGASVGLGFVAGPALGGLLSGVGGAVHTAPFLVAAALAFLGMMLCQFFVEESIRPDPKMRLPFAERWRDFIASGLGGFAVAVFLLNLAFAQVEVSFVLVMKDVLGFTSMNTGWVFTWIGVLIVIIQGGLIGPITSRIGDMGAALAGSVFLGAGQLMTMVMIPLGFLVAGSSIAGILLATTFVCVGFALTNPTLASASSKRARQGKIGGSIGLVQGFGSLGQVSGLILAGPLYEIGGGGLTFGAGSLICSGLVLSNLWIMLRGKPAHSGG
ncbi:MFS transporter [Alphaproteobacteria bacterium LSUCC0684]